LQRFGRNRRLVLMFEWLTLWPTWADLPVNSHRRDMALPLAISRSRLNPRGAWKPWILLDRGRIMSAAEDVKFAKLASFA